MFPPQSMVIFAIVSSVYFKTCSRFELLPVLRK
nr:unnamed protein product [Callosobruchus analis]